MAYTDPPHKVDDRKSPRDGDVDAPDADAADQQHRNGEHQHHRSEKPDSHKGEPFEGSFSGQDDAADLFGKAPIVVARADERRSIYSFLHFFPHLQPALSADSVLMSAPFGFVSLARYVVRGRVFSSARTP